MQRDDKWPKEQNKPGYKERQNQRLAKMSQQQVEYNKRKEDERKGTPSS